MRYTRLRSYNYPNKDFLDEQAVKVHYQQMQNKHTGKRLLDINKAKS